jgi:hypothetical protein
MEVGKAFFLLAQTSRDGHKSKRKQESLTDNKFLLDSTIKDTVPTDQHTTLTALLQLLMINGHEKLYTYLLNNMKPEDQ